MFTTVAVTVLASAAFAQAGPRLSRTLPPSVATWLMSVGALLAAAATSTALALVAFRVLAQTEPLSQQGHWSDAVLAARDPISTPAATAVLALLAALLAAGSRALILRTRATAIAFRLAREVGGDELAVLDNPDPSAFALPGRPGHIVVTSGLLRRLDGPQRSALLAHERAHLHQHHHVHQSATAVASALNPLLWPLRGAVGLSCERWADETAARVSARGAVVEALLRATAGTGRGLSAVALAASGGDVLARLSALEHPAPRLHAGRTILLVSLVLVAVAAVGVGMVSTEHLFELAQAAWRTGPR